MEQYRGKIWGRFRIGWLGLYILGTGCSGGGGGGSGGGGGGNPPGPDPPTPPASLSATVISSREVVLSWIDASEDETVFLVERAADVSGAPGTWVSAGVVLADHTAFYESDLLPEGTYWYRVSALKGDAPTLPSEPVSVTLPRAETAEAPPAATDLWLEVLSEGAITVHWTDAGDDEVVYVVERARDDDGAPGAWRVAGVTLADSVSFADEGLDAATTYWYRVKALREQDLESTSDPASASTGEPSEPSEPSAPRAPVEVAAAAQSTSSVLVSWLDGGDDAPVFHVELAPDSSGAPGDWSSAGTVLAGTSSFIVVGLEADTTYWFRVQSSDLEGRSGSSSAVSEATLAESDPLPPTAPEITSIAAVSPTEVEVAWSDASSDEVAFIVERKIDDGMSEWQEAGTMPADATTFTDHGLAEETSYLYRLSAVTARGDRGTSTIAGVATPAEGGLLPPGAPAGLALEALSSSTIQISWTDTSSDELVFAVERADDVSGVPGEWSVLRVLVADTTSVLDGSLSPETIYWYRVRALGEGSLSSVSDPVATATPALTPPDAPADLQANAVTSSRVELSWTDRSSDEAVFIIEVALDELGVPGTFNTDGYAPPEATSHVVDGLTPETTYWFRVTVLGTNNLTGSSAAVITTTPVLEDPETPAPPQINDVTALSPTVVVITWADLSEDEVGFLIERGLDDGGAGTDWTEIGSVLENETTYVDHTTVRETSYLYRVTAVVTPEITSTSEAVGVTTPAPEFNPGAPEGLAATALSSVDVSLTWTDASENELHFLLERANDYGGEPATWEIVKVLLADTTEVQDLVSAGGSYWYRVTAFLVGELAATSEAVFVTTPLNDLGTPEITSAAAVSTTSIAITWTCSTEGGEEFVIERLQSSDVEASWEEIATVGLEVSEYTDTGLSPGTAYAYRVSLLGAGSWPTTSEEALARTGWATGLGVGNDDISLAIGANGKIYVWGEAEPESGIGEPTVDVILTPREVEAVPGVIQVVTGELHTVALDEEGQVWAWGENWDFQVGTDSDPFIYWPYQVPDLTDVIKVSAGSRHTLALKSDGSVWAWGSDDDGRRGIEPNDLGWIPVQVPGLENIVDIAAGYAGSLALDADGFVYSWGGNDSGALGDGTFDSHTTPTRIEALSDIVAISLGWSSAFAIRDDGRLLAWGDGGEGQLGLGNDDSGVTTPQLVPHVQHIVAVAVSEDHAVALDSSGRVWTAGANDSGQLGDGTLSDRDLFEEVEGLEHTVTAVSLGYDWTYVLLSTGDVLAWGDNWHGYLGTGESQFQLVPAEIPDLEGVAAISAGDENSIALLDDGTIRIWGTANEGALGNGFETRTAWSPIPLEAPATFSVVEAGVDCGFAVVEGDGSVVAWGANWNGQLGAGVDESSGLPTTVLGLTEVTALAAGGGHVLALKGDGTVWAWGANWWGQLGNGTTDSSNFPVQVEEITDAVAIAAGGNHSLALLSDGTVWAWGANWVGQLGNGTTDNYLTPNQVSGLTGITAIACGWSHCLALEAEGAVWAWGSNWSGQLGDGSTEDRLLPVAASLLGPALQVTASSETSFAVLGEGQIVAVGDGSDGTLNDGDFTIRSNGAVQSTLDGVVSLEGSNLASYVLGLRSDGAVVSWGEGYIGQLGTGERLVWSAVPVQVSTP